MTGIGTVTFFVPGMPVGKGRPRATNIGGKARMYTPAKTASYESLVAWAAHDAMAGRAALDGPVVLELQVAMPVPSSWSRRARAAALADLAPPTRKPDIDNVIKIICDAVNGIVWGDDVQVVDCQLTRRYRETPGVRVMVARYVPPQAAPAVSMETLADQHIQGVACHAS